MLETNILGTYNLLEAALAVAATIFVNMGSSSEYGHKNQPMSEQDRPEPNTAYAVAKMAQTHLCNLMAQNGATNIVTLRLFSVYGSWETPTRLLPTLIRRARVGLPLEMSSPNTARDFIYVDDVSDVLVDFCRLSRFNGEVFNIGTGIQSTLYDVVQIVQKTVGYRSEVRWGAVPVQKWDADRWQADVSKTCELLGWSAKYSLAEGVQRMAAWMAERGDVYGRS